MRREAEKNLLEEEKKMQNILLDLEEQHRIQRQLESEVILREHETKQRAAFEVQFREQQQAIIAEEQRKFEEFRQKLHEENDKLEDVRRAAQEEKVRSMLGN